MQLWKCRKCERKIETLPSVWVSCCGKSAVFLGNKHCVTQRKPELKKKKADRVGQLSLFEEAV